MDDVPERLPAEALSGLRWFAGLCLAVAIAGVVVGIIGMNKANSAQSEVDDLRAAPTVTTPPVRGEIEGLRQQIIDLQAQFDELRSIAFLADDDDPLPTPVVDNSVNGDLDQLESDLESLRRCVNELVQAIDLDTTPFECRAPLHL